MTALWGVGEWAFAWPWILVLLPLPLLIWWIVPALSSTSRRALRVPSLERFNRLHSEARAGSMGNLRWWLVLLAWCLLVVATARPQWLGEPISSAVSGRDLMLGIDISGSMAEEDLYAGGTPQTRMDVVRRVGRDFISRRTGDRIGLIMFGSQAYVQTPLTFDHKTVQHFLGEAVVGLAGRSTAIGDAIGLAVKRLRDRPQESRVLILLTDGANSAGVVEPMDAARVAAENAIRIHTIGVGAQPEDVRARFGFRVQRSELDEQTLKSIAELTGGRYFRARDARELEAIYQAIDQIEAIDMDDQLFRPLREMFTWPLALAILLLLSTAVHTLWKQR
ncbi:MAG: VWA domain-containing protein [Gammaproteobacteria bacterium]|nr:VWA domain-containing protein [Gammaproteobacteria bacterium]